MLIILLLFNLGIYGQGINSFKGKDWSDKIKQAKKFIKKKQYFLIGKLPTTKSLNQFEDG